MNARSSTPPEHADRLVGRPARCHHRHVVYEQEYWRCPNCGEIDKSTPYRPGLQYASSLIGVTLARGPRELRCGHCGHRWKMPDPATGERQREAEVTKRLGELTQQQQPDQDAASDRKGEPH